jgi:hypothetical protein
MGLLKGHPALLKGRQVSAFVVYHYNLTHNSASTLLSQQRPLPSRRCKRHLIQEWQLHGELGPGCCLCLTARAAGG